MREFWSLLKRYVGPKFQGTRKYGIFLRLWVWFLVLFTGFCVLTAYHEYRGLDDVDPGVAFVVRMPVAFLYSFFVFGPTRFLLNEGLAHHDINDAPISTVDATGFTCQARPGSD